MEIEVGENEEFYDFNNYVTKLEKINGIQTVFILNNHSAYYVFTRDNMFKLFSTYNLLISSAFTFDNCYSSYEFQGIMPDSGAACDGSTKGVSRRRHLLNTHQLRILN
jgi:hypothetical protein